MKKKFKINYISILCGVLTVCMLVGFLAPFSSIFVASDTQKTVSYYVKSGGMGDGRSPEAPAATVDSVIASINADGLGKGDTANVYIMQRDDWNDGSKDFKRITAWAPYKSAAYTVPSYAATLVVQSYDPDKKGVKNFLSFCDTKNKQQSLRLAGPTVFKNICIVAVRSDYDGIIATGYDLTYAAGTTFGRANQANTDAWDGTITTTMPSLWTSMDIGKTGSCTYSAPQTVTVESDTFSGTTNNRAFYISSNGNVNATYKEDVTVIFNKSTITPRIVWGNATGYTSTFNKNLNVNIKSASSVTNINSSRGNVKIDGGLQMIVNSKTSVTGDVSAFTNVTATGGKWFITNKTEQNDLLGFTDTAGTFTVKQGYSVVATDTKTDDEYYSEDGVITMPAGKYTVSEYVPSEPVSYYVKNGGTGDGRKESTPAPTVASAIASINADGLGKKDTANIYIMQREDWNDASSSFNVTAWDEYVTSGAVTVKSHEAKIVVQPHDSKTKTYLAMSTSKAKASAQNMLIGGPTEFKNITLLSNDYGASNSALILANGNNLTMGEGVDFAAFNAATWDGDVKTITALQIIATHFREDKTYTNSQTVTIKNSQYASGNDVNRAFYLFGKAGQTYTYEKDLTLVVNNSGDNVKPNIYWGSNTAGKNTTVKGNLNINIKAANTVINTKNKGNVVVGGGLQMIVSSKAFVTGDPLGFDNVTATGGKWHITNETSKKDMLDFTSTAGTFSVKEGYTVVATDTQTATEYYSEDGVLTLPAGSYKVNEYGTPKTAKMLYIKTTESKKLLYQQAKVVVGKTYYFSFGISKDIAFTPVCYSDGDRKAVDANISEVSKTEKGTIAYYTYSYTIPEKDKADRAMTSLAFIGIQLTSASEGYFLDASVYDKDDEKKTELLKNPAFSEGVLDDWAWGWDAWFTSGKGLAGKTEWTDNDKKTTLKVMDLDESIFEVHTKKMLSIDTTKGNKLLQRARVEAEATYYFTFSLSNSIDFFTPICLSDGDRKNVDASIKLTERLDKEGYKTYTYSYTIPKTYIKSGSEVAITKDLFFGIQLSGVQKGYLFDASLYKKDEDPKKELFANPDFSNGVIDNWSWDWDWFIESKGLAGKTEWTNSAKDTTLKVVDYDESLFSKDPEVSPKMLYFTTTSSSARQILQRARVKVGESYYFTFSLNDTVKSFNAVCYSDGDRKNVDANIKLVEKVKKDGYTVYTYKYTIPKTYIKDGVETPVSDIVFFGVRFLIACEGYIFDTSVYKADDEFKTELFENPDFATGLDNWAWDWDVWFLSSRGLAGKTEWTNDAKTTTLKVLDYDIDLIKKLNSKMPGKQMVYFINGSTSSHFASRVTLVPNEVYYMQFSAFSTDEITIKVTEDGARKNVKLPDKELVSSEDHGNYTTYLYKFTMPEGLEKNLVFVGPVLKYYSEGYIFDMSLYSAKDETKTNMWINADFAAGLDGWIWDWNVWFGRFETGVKEWTDGPNTVKLVDFDTAKIDSLIAELNINDGVWWKASDVAQDQSLGTASLFGTFVDKNGQPLPDITLVLRSSDNSYTTVTNADGEFAFKKFVEGFYELYVVDENGNEISTGYYTNFAAGDVVNLKLGLGSPNDEDTGLGSVYGTVYTSDLKTVSNLKLYFGSDAKVVSDSKGGFKFENVPVGDYELYTILKDGSKYVFRTVSVKSNVDLTIKVKYAPEVETSSPILIIILSSAAGVIILAGGIALFFILKKKKAKLLK